MDTVNTAVDLAVVVGFVNTVSHFFKVEDSRIKIGLATAAALFLTFIPVQSQIANVVNLLFGSSGLYKSLQVVGAIRR